MLVLRRKNPDFYVRDEPANHLDIEGQEALEHGLMAHGTACLLVRLDRSILRMWATGSGGSMAGNWVRLRAQSRF